MRRVSVPRSVVAGAITSAAALALAVGSSAPATADPPPAATMEFQVPIRFVTWCTLAIYPCMTLQPATITPSATTGTPGAVTFAAKPPYCREVWVNWLNLTTGSVGTVLLRPVPPDYSRPYVPGEWCHYTPATAVTGSGTIAATADLAPAESQVVITPGMGTFQVP
ncbi:hypothetical protein [Rhodococcus tukisamuensis]|uniref:Secreted protein n=1 Tax=Rhodococcus tukisamuensis TaxID=168276 RepID=A0A1G6UJW3_9NOCA|nr:hypothetical protein [Rhodococcus tukisamuensis]SDD40847.1 hypothetical protein SAMN05444580_104196 [Rhodococcus tukisamuensis]